MPWTFWLIFFVLGVVVLGVGAKRFAATFGEARVEPAERLSLYGSKIAISVVSLWSWSRGALGPMD